MIIENCPICNQKLEVVVDKDGFLIDHWCNRCGCSWAIFDLEIEEKKISNLDIWLKNK